MRRAPFGSGRARRSLGCVRTPQMGTLAASVDAPLMPAATIQA